MMGWGGNMNMMGASGGFGFLIWLVLLVDLVLLGVYLLKKIQK